MGIDDSIVVDEKVECAGAQAQHSRPSVSGTRSWSLYLALLLIAGSVYLTGIISPPSLSDDVDSVQAQIARTMLTTGDWVSARLNGVLYLEKPPLVYWMMALSYKVFGVHDWAARIPIALFCVGLCLLTAAFGIWAFGRKAGFLAGVVMSTCVGLYLFTRILIPDVILTFTITLAMWALLRITDEAETHPGVWAFLMYASLGAGLLLKSLIGVLFPVAAGLIYLFFAGQLTQARTWKRLHPVSGVLLVLLIAAPWHVLATLRNPPYFSLSMHSGPGEYHGFLWFFFINEQLLRFLNLRYPRDYNTVPRLWFWLFHLAWLFPWSVYFPAVAKLSFRPLDRAGRARLLALCWVGFVLVFFTFSTTQEYYSMPCYPALALLLGAAMAADGVWIRRGTRILTAVSAVAAAIVITILVVDRHVATPGDIFSALTAHPAAYTLSLGHMEDLTLQSFAYLRVPLLLAGIALLIGAVGTFRAGAKRAFISAALMMLVFFQAARLALIVFDPDLSSRVLANVMEYIPPGQLIFDRHYYAFSSIVFYANRPVLLLNGRVQNLSYGSYAPGAPDVFLDDAQLKQRWTTGQRYYLVAHEENLSRFQQLLGQENLHLVVESGGKFMATNLALSETRLNSQVRPTINPASAAQTRYILLGRNLLAPNQADKRPCLSCARSHAGDGWQSSPSDRVAPAVRGLPGVPEVSLVCMSPEEDA